jgi:hypothetical protein
MIDFAHSSERTYFQVTLLVFCINLFLLGAAQVVRQILHFHLGAGLIAIMNDELRALFKESLRKCLARFHAEVAVHEHYAKEWKKTGSRNWRTENVMRKTFEPRSGLFEEIYKDAGPLFVEKLFAQYPQYDGMVGSRLTGIHHMRFSKDLFLHIAVIELWKRFQRFDVPDSAIDEIVNEFAAFVGSPTIEIGFQSVLLNFQMADDLLELAHGVRIRRLSETEVTFYNPPTLPFQGPFDPRYFTIQEFGVEGTTIEKILFGQGDESELNGVDMVKRRLAQVILALRTFKEGPVGHDQIHFFPIMYSPIQTTCVGVADEYVPSGTYELRQEEIDAFKKHASLIADVTDEAMLIGCNRLADTGVRVRPQDRLLDAVIGMEALLLAGASDGKSELSFRFALNYAMLFPVEKREAAFRLAKDLYSMRSSVAHGSHIDEGKLKIANKKMTLVEASRIATEALRSIVKHFLPMKDSPFRKAEYWRTAHLGLTELDSI